MGPLRLSFLALKLSRCATIVHTHMDAPQDYQVWIYDPPNDVISEHEPVGGGLSQADAEEMVVAIERKILHKGVKRAVKGTDTLGPEPPLSMSTRAYLRRHGEPTYLLYNVFPGDRWVLYDMAYHKKEADRLLEVLENAAKSIAEHGGPTIIPVMDKRDDSEDRGETNVHRENIGADDDMPALENAEDNDVGASVSIVLEFNGDAHPEGVDDGPDEELDDLLNRVRERIASGENTATRVHMDDDDVRRIMTRLFLLRILGVLRGPE